MRQRGPLVVVTCALVAGVFLAPVHAAAQAAAPAASTSAPATPARRPAAAAPAGAALSFPPASPEALGLSPKGLARITAMVQGFIDQKRVAGAVTLILRDGKIAYTSALGSADVEQAVPMRTDTIFRIASQSKAITTTAALMLVDEGKLLLNEPVSKYIPAFRHTTVMVPPAANAAPGSPVSTVAARRQITMRDLMTHSSGVSYGGNAATRPLYLAAGFDDWYFANKAEPIGVVDREAGDAAVRRPAG